MGLISANIPRVFMEVFAAVEDVVQADIFFYDIDIVDGSSIGELARRSVGKHSSTVRLLRYNSHICWVSKINALFRDYRCPSCDQFMNKAVHTERHLTSCQEKVKQVFRKNVYQLRETMIHKLHPFNILENTPQWPKVPSKHNKMRFWKNSWAENQIPRCRYNNLDWQSSSNICINFMQLDWITKLFRQFQARSSGWVIWWCSPWVSNTKPSANEIKSFVDWD